MKYLQFIGLIFIALSILFVGFKINRTIYKSGAWEKQKAFMEGIKAQGFPPEGYEMKADTEYVLWTYKPTDDVFVTKIYPGFGAQP